MRAVSNDRWRAAFPSTRRQLGIHGDGMGRSVSCRGGTIRAARIDPHDLRWAANGAALIDRPPARRPRGEAKQLRDMGAACASREGRSARRRRAQAHRIDELAITLAERYRAMGLALRSAILRSWSTASGRASRLVRVLSALGRRRAGRARHVRATSKRGCRTSPTWASTCCTCRRSIRSAATQRKGPNNALDAQARRRRQPVGDRRAQKAATRRSIPSSARSTTSSGSSRRRASARHRDRARHRVPVLARPSVRAGASRVVPAAARRHDPVRREPAEEVPGHLSVRLRERRLAGAVGGAAERLRVLDRAGRARLPRRQPAHQAVPRSGSGASRE